MNTKKSTYHHGNLREVLVCSALEILKEGTLQDLSLRALARKAGVSQTAPYRHFEDKQALIVVLIEEGSLILQEAMRIAAEQSDDPVESLINMAISYYDFADKHPAHFRLMFGGNIENKEKYSSLLDIEKKGYELVQHVVGECMKLPNAPKMPEQLIRLTCWSLVHGLANLLLNDVASDDIPNDEDKREVVSEAISFYIRAMFEK